MHAIDFTIVGLYVIALIFGGMYFQRRAAQDIDGFFLGGRKLPWWALGASGMAGNVDISGTMIGTALVFALGTSGFFVELRGGVVLIMAFLMVFMGKWNRRGQVMTLAEWMHLRFGKGLQGNAARMVSAITSLVLTLALISYFAIATGKFAAEFLSIDWRVAALLMVALAAFYTMASGLQAVVWLDVFQGSFIFLTCLIIVGFAFGVVPPFALDAEVTTSVPLADGGFQQVTTTYGQWSGLVPPMNFDLPGSYGTSFNLFGMAIGFYFLKAVLEGFGGANSYMAQRFFASGSDRESGLTSALWIILLMFRWPLTAGVALMGLHLMSTGPGLQDPEMVLPTVINTYLPMGIKGLVVAGFLAAAMSTVASTVNAGSSYWVKDLYQGFIRPKATEKSLIFQSRAATVVLLLVGTLMSFLVRNVNEIWDMAMMGIASGLLVPQLMRWYWWRFNGFGFAAAAACGMVAAIGAKLLFPDITGYQLFWIGNCAALVAAIVVSLATPPTAPDVLRRFYRVTRPFGLWNQFLCELPEATRQAVRRENRRDLIALMFAVPWQLSLFLTGLMLVFRRWDHMAAAFACFAICTAGLFWFWFRHLSSTTVADMLSNEALPAGNSDRSET